MAITHSKYTRGAYRAPAAQWAGNVVAVRYEFAYDNAASDGDIVELGILPAHHTVRDMTIDCTDVDGGTDFETDVGLMNGEVGDDVGPDGTTPRTCGAEFFSGSTVGRTSASGRMSLATGFRIAPTDKDRSIGVKLVDQGTTTGTYAITVLMGT
jgi:hypothetical protein